MTTRRDDCPFCQIASGEHPAKFATDPRDGTELSGQHGNTMVFAPLRPHTPGHLLVVPTIHVRSAASDPQVAAFTMEDAAAYCQAAGGHWNILTSIGREATQTVMHLHLHLVPRSGDVSLPKAWPWVKRP